jgi:sulfur carrier protein ThiS
MRVKVSLELTLSKYRLNGQRECFIQLPGSARVKDVLHHFHIPGSEPLIIVKNGRGAKAGDYLNDGDELIILPLMEGG